jgi:DNA-binding FadR family transcriptional regulator
MALRPVQDRSLGDRVFDQLAAEILSERYPAGSPLPPERTLAEVFRVNRHVVREALKRLEQLGLVMTSRSGRTEVPDFKRNAGLEVLAIMAEHARGGNEANKYLLSVLEMRALIGTDVVRLCALRASPEVRGELTAIAAAMAEAGTDDALFQLEVRFWEKLLDGADNIAYRLAFNSLLKGQYAMGLVGVQWSLAEIRASEFRAPLAAAIAAGDAAKAEGLIRALMRQAIDVVAAVVSGQAGRERASR